MRSYYCAKNRIVFIWDSPGLLGAVLGFQIMTPQRWQRSRRLGSRQPSSTRYCGRGTKYGNPHVVEHAIRNGKDIWIVATGDCETETFTNRVVAHARAVELYKNDFMERAKHDRGLIARTKQELGQYEYLSCFCDLSLPCHVDFLIEVVNMPGVWLL